MRKKLSITFLAILAVIILTGIIFRVTGYGEGDFPKVPIPSEFFGNRGFSLGDRITDVYSIFNDSVREETFSYPGSFILLKLTDKVSSNRFFPTLKDCEGECVMYAFQEKTLPYNCLKPLSHVSISRAMNLRDNSVDIDSLFLRMQSIFKQYYGGSDSIIVRIEKTNTSDSSAGNSNSTSAFECHIYTYHYDSFLHLTLFFDYSPNSGLALKKSYTMSQNKRLYMFDAIAPSCDENTGSLVRHKEYVSELAYNKHTHLGFKSIDSVWATIKNGTWQW